MKREALHERVKQTIHEVGAETDIICYGSRARGDAHAESDWDFLILLDGAGGRTLRCYYAEMPTAGTGLQTIIDRLGRRPAGANTRLDDQ